MTDVRVSSLREMPVSVYVISGPGIDSPQAILPHGGAAYVRAGKLRIANNNAELLGGFLDAAVLEVRRIGRATHQITLDDGRVVETVRSGRCVCGSPLKRFDAWRAS